jgi:HAD superfamily hydrolase (TIGR01459 family)
MSVPVPFIDRLAPFAESYDAVLSDVWGVIHNGVAATPEACDALVRFRAKGGTVALITNAPRPGAVVSKFLDKLNVPREAYDTIVSSGDVSRAVISKRPGRNVFHIGPPRDLGIFEGLGLNFVSLGEADYAVCTGLQDDETETPESYRAMLAKMHERNLFMVCGNPDLVVERGDKLVYCAGAIADLYAELGGDVLYAGKPHAPIYQECLNRVTALRGHAPDRSKILAIGDSVRTDVTGATRMGIDCLFVTAGIHAEEVGRDRPNDAALSEMFASAGASPKAVTQRLRW